MCLRNCAILICHFVFSIITVEVEKIKSCRVEMIPNGKFASEVLHSYLPHRTLVPWIHGRSQGTTESFCKIPWVWQWTQYPDWTGWMNRWPYFRKSVFWPHRTTPDLGVVEEEELVVCEVYPREARLLSVLRHPLLVSLDWKIRSLFL
jgi:hypothetical protein